jgi:branched-chain amino acid aminotransferase
VFEGARMLRRDDLRAATAHRADVTLGRRSCDFDLPSTVAEIERATRRREPPRAERRLSRAAAWRGAEPMGVSAPELAIHVAVASWAWPSYYEPEQKMKGVRLGARQVQAALAGDGAHQQQGRGSVHDLHPVQARGGAGRATPTP